MVSNSSRVIQQAAECLFVELTSKIFHIYIQLRMVRVHHGKQTPERTGQKQQDIIRNELHVILRIITSLIIYSFVRIITDLSVGHLNLFVVVECIVNCFIKKNYNFVPYFINRRDMTEI